MKDTNDAVKRYSKMTMASIESEISKISDSIKEKIPDSIVVYGNWCGPHYGGFDNNCSDVCNGDLWNITEDCLKCNPPIDYTDRQCMLHDLCAIRHNVLKWGSTGCDFADSDLSVSVPCECNHDLARELDEEHIEKGCGGDKDCLEKGRLIREGIHAQACGCRIDNCFKIPHFNQLEMTKEEKCINYDACIPTSVCKLF